MPYIQQGWRGVFDPLLKPLAEYLSEHPISEGDLNYIITKILMMVLDGSFRIKPASYRDLNLILGVLEAVKQEFYRRVVAPYEDKKREENGDVYV